MKKFLAFCASLSCLLLIWHCVALRLSSPLILPLPSAVARRVGELLLSRPFLLALKATALRCFLSLSLVVVSGFAFGVLCALFPVFAAVALPLLSMIRSVPVISVLLIALFWLKSDFVGIFVAFLMAFPIMTTSVADGFRSQSKELSEMADCYCLTKAQKFAFLRVTEAFSSVKTGIKNTSGMMWKLVAAGEVLSLPRLAVGSLLQNAQIVLETADVFAITLIIIASSFAFSALASLALFLCVLCAKGVKKKYFARKRPVIKEESEKNFEDIDIKHFSFSYTADSLLYSDFSLTAEKSAVTALLAPSGCGKTTLLNHVAKEERARGKKVCYLFQESRLLPSLNVIENVVLPILLTRKNSFALAREMLSLVGLGGCEGERVQNLSGGEKQRVALARALAFGGEVMLLDEPFQSLDFSTKKKMLALFTAFHAENPCTTLFVTHDPKEAALLSERIVVLKGRSVKIAEDLLSADYPKALLEEKIINAL